MGIVQDLRYTLRAIARAPGFAALACATLALGVGANAAVFSVADAALFRPLPYADPDRPVTVYRMTETVDGERIEVNIDALSSTQSAG